MQVAVDMSCTRWAKRGPLLLCLVCLFSCAFSMNVDENARNIFEALSKTLNCGKVNLKFYFLPNKNGRHL